MPRTISITGSPDEKIEQLARLVEEIAQRVHNVEARATASEISLHGALIKTLLEANMIDRARWIENLKSMISIAENLDDPDHAAAASRMLRAYAREREANAPFTVIDGGKAD